MLALSAISYLLRCMSPLLAQSGHDVVAPHMSAFGGKADIRVTSDKEDYRSQCMLDFWPKRKSVRTES